MTISGPNMHRQLLDGYRQAQSDLERARAGLDQFTTQRGDLDADRSKALLELAEHYLPDLSRESIEHSWIEVRAKLSGILTERDQDRDSLERSLNSIRDKLNLQEDRLFEMNESLDDADKEQERLSSETETRLASDESFVALSNQAAVAEAALERAEMNLDEIDQDSAKKLPAYRESSLFTYLKDRGYGTSEYTKRGFTRRMDRWVAKLIGFHKAKQNYEFLVKTPERMRGIIAEDRQALGTVMEELEKRRDAVAEEIGLTAAITRWEQLTEQREDLLAELRAAQSERERFEAELNDLDDPRGRYYREAVSEFRDMLTRFDSRDLERRASRTPSLSDDQIVGRLLGVEAEIEDLARATRRHHEGLVDRQDVLNALGNLMQRFRAAKFDAARSHFEAGVDVMGSISRARTERDIEELWDQLRKSQRWGPTFGEKMAQVASHPATQLLVSAMAQAAGHAMRNHARRAGRRHYRSRRRVEPWFRDSSDSFRGW